MLLSKQSWNRIVLFFPKQFQLELRSFAMLQVLLLFFFTLFGHGSSHGGAAHQGTVSSSSATGGHVGNGTPDGGGDTGGQECAPNDPTCGTGAGGS